MELGRTRAPSPHAGGTAACPDPQIPFAVFIQSDRADAGATVVAVAFSAAGANHAQRPPEVEERRRPDRDLMIFDEPADIASGQSFMLSELPIFPLCEPFIGCDPEGTVACAQKMSDVDRWELLIRRRLPGHWPHAVEAQHAE